MYSISLAASTGLSIFENKFNTEDMNLSNSNSIEAQQIINSQHDKFVSIN